MPNQVQPRGAMGRERMVFQISASLILETWPFHSIESTAEIWTVLQSCRIFVARAWLEEQKHHSLPFWTLKMGLRFEDSITEMMLRSKCWIKGLEFTQGSCQMEKLELHPNLYRTNCKAIFLALNILRRPQEHFEGIFIVQKLLRRKKTDFTQVTHKESS